MVLWPGGLSHHYHHRQTAEVFSYIFVICSGFVFVYLLNMVYLCVNEQFRNCLVHSDNEK